MKKLKLLAFIGVIAMLFSACAEEEEDFSIIGKWNVDKVTTTMTFLGETETEVETNAGWIEFKKDGTATTNDSSETVTWSLSGNKLTVTYDDEVEGPITITYTLTTMEKNKMVMEYTESAFGITVSQVVELSKL